jgi:hypothetical protein
MSRELIPELPFHCVEGGAHHRRTVFGFRHLGGITDSNLDPPVRLIRFGLELGPQKV